MSYSKSANTPRTKKMKKRDASSWIKQDKSDIHDPSAPQAFSRQASIMKLRQIATVAKTKTKPKKQTLIDIIYESDEEDEDASNNNHDDEDVDTDPDTLMPPMLDRRFGLSADTGMNELVNQRNKQHTEMNDASSWVKQKKEENQSCQG